VIEPLIFTIRGKKVILDAELARIYRVTTKVFNQAVKRNKRKFPTDFVFQLTTEEYEGLRSQFVTSSQKLRNPRYLPYPFTEHGAVMAANVLNSAQAVKMSVFVMRAFVLMKRELISRSELEKRLLKVENVLLAHDHHIRNLYEKIRPLLLPLPEPKPEPPKKRIGFLVEEPHVPYKSLKGNKRKRPL
jgi:hypothetical protein